MRVHAARFRPLPALPGHLPRDGAGSRTMLRTIADQVQAVMRANPHIRQVNQDWGERVADRPFRPRPGSAAAHGPELPPRPHSSLQFLLTGVPVTQVREDIRTVEVVARSAGPERLDPARLDDFTLTDRATGA